MDKLEESFDGTFTENIRSQAYKSQASSRKNRLVVNVAGTYIAHADTQYAVVKHVTHKNKCFLQTEPISNLSFDLCWTDNHVRPDLFSRMQFNQKINHFPGIF